MSADDFVWRPDAQGIEGANVTRLMRKLGYVVDGNDPVATERTTREFVARTQREIEWFWDAALADLGVQWTRPYSRVLDASRGNAWADWFLGGETNIALNCVDRHAHGSLRDKVALIAEAEDASIRRYTFAQLDTEVCRLANALKSLGIGRGDTVACYMPMIAEVVFAMLATQKIGAVFIPIFSGYAPPAVRERLEDAAVKLVFTADTSSRRGQALALKVELDRALAGLGCVKHVIVAARGTDVPACPMSAGRDHAWASLVARQSSECVTESMQIGRAHV
jgi:acetyl-CoA synthetase